jgi:hypothetical protein
MHYDEQELTGKTCHTISLKKKTNTLYDYMK